MPLAALSLLRATPFVQGHHRRCPALLRSVSEYATLIAARARRRTVFFGVYSDRSFVLMSTQLLRLIPSHRMHAWETRFQGQTEIEAQNNRLKKLRFRGYTVVVLDGCSFRRPPWSWIVLSFLLWPLSDLREATAAAAGGRRSKEEDLVTANFQDHPAFRHSFAFRTTCLGHILSVVSCRVADLHIAECRVGHQKAQRLRVLFARGRLRGSA